MFIALINDSNVFVSLDVVSLFTTVPLKKNCWHYFKIHLYGKEITTIHTKRSLKKLILDTCQKTSFFFNGKMYEQADGVSMRRSLGPVLANIVMTECEKVSVNQLIENKLLKSMSDMLMILY